MKLSEKIEKLNNFCEGSLGFQHWNVGGWEVSSFEAGSLFGVDGKLYRSNSHYIQSKTFEGVVDLAYKAMLKKKKELPF